MINLCAREGSTCRGQKRVLGRLNWKWHVIMISLMWVLGLKPGSSERVCPLCCWAISPPPKAFSVDFSFSNEIWLRGRTRQGVRRSRHRCHIYFLIAFFLHCVNVSSLVLSWVSSSLLELHLSCPTIDHSLFFLTGLLLCAPPTLSFCTSKTRMG